MPGAVTTILRKNLFAQNVFIVDSGIRGSFFAKEIEDVKDFAYKIKGFVGTEEPVYNPHRASFCLAFKVFYELLGNNKFKLMSLLQVALIIVVLDDVRGVAQVL